MNKDNFSGSISHSGNDVVELSSSVNVSIDIIGVIGNTNNFAQNVIFRKKTGVGTNKTYNTGDYDSYSVDTFGDIGSHTF